MEKVEIKHFKVLQLPVSAEPDSIYYVLDSERNKVKTYITDVNGIAIPLIDLKGEGVIESVTGTAVTGTITNPEINIVNLVSSELGNLVKLSSVDGKLKVNKITSPNLSLEVVNTTNELQLQIASSLLEKINNALQPEDITQYTNEDAQDAVGNILVDSNTVDLVYNDITPQISASVKQNSITNNELSSSVNNSLNLANTSLQPVAIQNFFDKLVDDTDDIVEGTIKKFTTISEKNFWNLKQEELTEDNVGEFMNLVIPTKLTPNSNDTLLARDFLTNKAVELEVGKFQEKLISGTNIKTINGDSLLGLGNLEIKDYIEVDNYSVLISTIGVSEKIYLTRDDNKLYRFNGTIYVPLGGDVSAFTKKTKIVIEGDSRSALPSPTTIFWDTYFKQNSVLGKEASITNLAAGGQTLLQMLASFNSTVLPLAPSANELAYFVLIAGANDMGAENRTGVDSYNTWLSIVTAAKNAGFIVVASTETGASTFTSGQKVQVKIYNDLIRADRSKYDYLIEPEISIPINSSVYYSDGIHLTDLGSKMLAKIISNELTSPQRSNNEDYVSRFENINAKKNISLGSPNQLGVLSIKTENTDYFRGLFIEDAVGNSGLFSASFDNFKYFGGNTRYYNSGQFRSENTVGSFIQFDNEGKIRFYADDGLAKNVSYAPSQKFRIGVDDNSSIVPLNVPDAVGDSQATNLGQLNAALVLKANLSSPSLTGTPTAPTATAGTANTQIANTLFVNQNTVTLTGNQTINGTKTFSAPVVVPNANGITQAVNKGQLDLKALYANQTITANKSINIIEFVNGNELILSVDATSGNITITLPTFTSLQGYKLTVKKMDSSANSVLIQGVGGINIDGSASVIISGQYSSSTVGANLSQYIIL